MTAKATPQGINCGPQNKIDEFVSDAWMQIDPIYDRGHTFFWICPDCISKTRECQELRKQAVSNYMEAIGDEKLSKECWQRIAKVNQKILDNN